MNHITQPLPPYYYFLSIKSDRPSEKTRFGRGLGRVCFSREMSILVSDPVSCFYSIAVNFD